MREKVCVFKSKTIFSLHKYFAFLSGLRQVKLVLPAFTFYAVINHSKDAALPNGMEELN